MNSNPNFAITLLREAGRVERCAHMPHHGSYTNGQHAYDMQTLVLMLWPEVTRALMIAIVAHNVHERYTGNIPEAFRRSDGEFAKRLAVVEAKVMKRIGTAVTLTEQESCWLRGLDHAVQFMWATEQIALGNKNAAALLGQTGAWFKINAIPIPLKEFIETYQWTRTPDEIPR